MILHPLQKHRAEKRFLVDRYQQKVQTVGDNCFFSVVVITMIKGESVKVLADSKKGSGIEKIPHIPNEEDTLNQKVKEMAKVQNELLCKLEIDLAKKCI